MSELERGQVNRSAAEVYEAFFVPALFQQWAGLVADAARISAGQRVLDVACGTGVLARVAADRVGPSGSVVGLDLNDGMLAVAKRTGAKIEWQRGRVEALPFADMTFDAVVSQFGLTFFDDREASIREMMRVLRSGGRMAVAVWASLDATPGYAAVAAMLGRLFGDEAASALHAPFALGDLERLRGVFADAGVAAATITTHRGTARFSSIREWMFTDVKGWTLADLLDERQYARLLAEADQTLQAFVGDDGRVAFEAPAHIVTATKD